MKKQKESKEDKALNTWIPIGTMIGTVIGMILSFSFNNFLYLGGCAVGGLLLGFLMANIVTEGGIEIEKKKKKRK